MTRSRCESEEGVVRVLEMLRAEADLAMALCGARMVEESTADLAGSLLA
jgi:isopentenyl diphosphate isomerase/L-lactate dehydrogenase-like FMN-dependent dehydrogenase